MSRVFCCLFLVLPVAVLAQASVVPGRIQRVFADFEVAPWHPSEYSTASGTVRLANDVPEAVRATSRKSMEVRIDYSGTGFEAFTVMPSRAALPGRLEKVSLWVKPLVDEYSWFLQFTGPDGKNTYDGKKLEVALRGRAGEWKRIEFSVPHAWPQPLSIGGIGGHNWGKQSVRAAAGVLIDQFRVTTDLSDVDPKQTQLLAMDLTCPRSRNLFIEGDPVEFALAFDSWLGKPVTGTVQWHARDLADDDEWVRAERRFQFRDLHHEIIRLSPKRFGVHELTLTCRLSTGDQLEKKTRFAYVPLPRKLTEEEKVASPWGINIHGGTPGVAYGALARCGFAWVRDYAYSFPWMLRARGADGKYGGWPWYPKMERKLKASGLMLLPCLVGAIDRNAAREGKSVPGPQWRRDLLHVLISFPQHKVWELDNEYDYKHGEEEAATGWATYEGYHRVFGRAVHFIDKNMLAVEQGTAGVFPERVEKSVKNGAFDDIDVVNCHHYCGTDPPEVNVFNRNVGDGNVPPRLFFDALRELVAAARVDGKDRQVWITEFGWDTRAGHIVPERVQAAYLQRGYLLGLQAGLDKLFWYWNRDTKGKPKHFFDGCGIWDPVDEPKPAAAAAAALAHFLKRPDPLGDFNLGPNTLGYVFQDDGRLVACAFKIEDRGAPKVVEFTGGDCFDMYGNPATGRKHALSIEPVWCVGIPENDPLVKQTAFSLTSRHLVCATAGDTVTITCTAHNRGPQVLRAGVAVTAAPAGWGVEPRRGLLRAASGGTAVASFVVTAPDTAKQGRRTVALTVTDGTVSKALIAAVRVEPSVSLAPVTLSGLPGKTEAVVRIRNRSSRPKTVRVQITTPRSWRAAPAEKDVRLAHTAETKTTFALTWNADWRPGETATVRIANAANATLATTGIIPPEIHLVRVADIRYDGDLSEWPAAARIPKWALGCRTGSAAVEAYAGYSDAGLHFAFRVRNSRMHVADPRLFWLQDAIEVFVDTKGDRTPRKEFAGTDHQFWICPLAAEKRAYVGQWKRFAEIPATKYDIPGVKSFAGKRGDGYVVEVLIPASSLDGFTARSGARIGLSLNLTVLGRNEKREVFWPRPKDWSVLNMPNTWGTAVLE